MFIVDSLTNPVPINGRRLFPGGSTDRHLSFLIRVPTSESVEPQFSPDYRPAIFLGLRERVNNVETMKNLSLVDSMMILRIGGLSPKRVKIHSSCFRRNQDLKFWNIQCAQSILKQI